MNDKCVIATRGGVSHAALMIGLASGLVLAGGGVALAQSVPFNQTINGYTLSGTQTPASPTAANTAGTINGNGASNVPFNVVLTQLSRSSYNYNGTVNGQPVNCTANQTGSSSYSLSGNCGYLSQIFTPTATPTNTSAARQQGAIQTERALTQQTTDLIGRRIADALPVRAAKSRQTADAGELSAIESKNGISGVSGGDGEYTKALWATYSHSWLANNWSGLKSRSDLNTGVVGGDVKFGSNLLTGLTFTYQSTSAITSYNDGLLDSSAYTFTPYLAYSLLDNKVVLDLMTGFGFSDSTASRSRSSGAISGSYGGDRWLLATHATYNAPVGNWDLSAKLGWSLSYDWSDKFTESNGVRNSAAVSRVGELSLGGKAGYTFEKFEPYLGLTFLYDPILGPNNSSTTGASLSKTELNAQLGINWTASDRLTASLEVSNAFLRKNEDNTTLVVAARYAF